MPGVTAIVLAGTPLACFSDVKPRRALALILIAITSADCAGQYLEVAQQVPVAWNTLTGAVADVDQNGWPDVLSEHQSQGALIVYLNPALQGFGSYQSYDPSPCCAGAGILSVGLVDQDTYLDVVQGGGSILMLMLNGGNGTFNNSFPLLPNTGSVYRHYLADVNNDGRSDLVIQRNQPTPAFGPYYEVWLNLYPSWVLSWSFTPPSPASSWNVMTGVRDVDGDGNLDLVAQYIGPSSVPGCISSCSHAVVHTGNGAGTFSGPQLFNIGGNIYDLGDFDGDGRADVLVLQGQSSIAIAYGHPTLILEPTTTVVTLVSSQPVLNEPRIADLDADGFPDILTRWFQSDPAQPLHQIQHVGGFRGVGPRSFTSTLWDIFTAPWQNYFRLVPGDLDLDGDSDVVGVPESPQLYYFRNNAIYGAGCPGTGGTVPTIGIGSPTIGNPLFGISLANALGNAPAVLGVSTAKTQPVGCGLALDLTGLVLPTGLGGITTTSGLGGAWFGAPLPNVPSLLDVQGYAQWAVLDPSGALPALGTSFALSNARTIILR